MPQYHATAAAASPSLAAVARAAAAAALSSSSAAAAATTPSSPSSSAAAGSNTTIITIISSSNSNIIISISSNTIITISSSSSSNTIITIITTIISSSSASSNTIIVSSINTIITITIVIFIIILIIISIITTTIIINDHLYIILSSLTILKPPGKAVFSEKPITADVDTTRVCYEKAEAKNLPFLCAFHRRFDPSLMAVKASLEAGQSGHLRLLRSSSHDHSPPPIDYVRHSGGILKDSTIHDLDMALWMAASPARKVYVQGRAFDPDIRSVGDLDLVVVSVEHESGSVSVIDNGRRCAHGYDQRLEAICEDGSFVVTNRSTHQLYTHGPEVSTRPGIDAGFDTRYPQAYLNEMEHFLDVLDGQATLRVTKQDTLAAMQLAEAAAKSAQTGQVVTIGEP
ncbi:LOW QUALITY PROTEIN: inositol 2-dehydrogenase [Elysia marginata]|uniref:Inositol 2-dehydrogenase n=1 Tax=Elysia marginata TaxID=1093978 RepID=A0AAV4IBW4_9GAST|nr:LOW QUALITY PROTEIN: inositol 2-dehydrogenase [Elysia marginata]